MKIGDLVQFIDRTALLGRRGFDRRNIGMVLKFDSYNQPGNRITHTLGNGEAIAEILWSSGEVGWILKTRVEVVA